MNNINSLHGWATRKLALSTGINQVSLISIWRKRNAICCYKYERLFCSIDQDFHDIANILHLKKNQEYIFLFLESRSDKGKKTFSSPTFNTRL